MLSECEPGCDAGGAGDEPTLPPDGALDDQRREDGVIDDGSRAGDGESPAADGPRTGDVVGGDRSAEDRSVSDAISVSDANSDADANGLGDVSLADGASDASDVATQDVGSQNDGASDANGLDAGRADVSDAGDAAAPCPGTAGPTPVRVGSFCIDSTEVTNDQFAAFLATNPSTSAQPPVCAFNTSFTPQAGWPPAPTRGSYPVAYIDWCGAKAYCAWAGKRLCGGLGGGPTTVADATNKNVDQWYVACSANGTKAYPYGGSSYIAGKCNDAELGVGGALPVASMSGCVGGYPGIYDMDGNLWEWEDGCDGETGPNDACLVRGGSFAYPGGSYAACTSYAGISRSGGFSDTGIRCCSP